MPIDYALDTTTRIVHTEIVGRIDAEEFRAHAERMDADASVQGVSGEFVDLSRADLSALRGPNVRDLASMLADTPVSHRLAVWAPADLTYAISRIYGSSASVDGVDVAVFRDRDQALAWLLDRMSAEPGPTTNAR